MAILIGSFFPPFEDTLVGTNASDLIIGLGGDDTLDGGGGDDMLLGGAGDDLLLGGRGADALLGGEGEDTLVGGEGDDFASGDAGDDVFIGGGGDDLYIGGTGVDDVDYSGLDADITLLASGMVDKGALGRDQIFEIERIVGSSTGTNTIDGATSGPSTVSLFVDLSQRIVEMRDVPFFGAQTYAVENFQNVVGTRNDDQIVGDDGDNVIFGSFGNDLLRGGLGDDTVDYSGLGVAVTLQTAGMVLKDGGAAGMDFLGAFDPGDLAGFETFERVIGAAGRSNVIDGTSRSGAVNVEVDLAAESFAAEVKTVAPAFPAFLLGTRFGFAVENFTDVIGTRNDDVIKGDDGDNVVTGSLGNDALLGRGGSDTLTYEGAGFALEVVAGGVFRKFDAFGVEIGVDTVGAYDVLAGEIDVFETVIADGAFANTLNGGGAFANIVVDLSAESITSTLPNAIGGFPDGFTFGFRAVNFDNVVGSDLDDVIKGDDGDNVVAGSLGNDALLGRGGSDTLTYEGAGFALEVVAGGVFRKLDASGVEIGVDTVGAFDVLAGEIDVFETVIADGAFANTLNGGGAFASVDVDLSQQRIDATIGAGVGGFPAGFTFGFDAINFVNAIGSDLGDRIIGGSVANELSGGLGDDTIRGRGGDDVIDAGAGRDNVRGDGGADTFVFTAASILADAATPHAFTRVQDLSQNDLVFVEGAGGELFTAAQIVSLAAAVTTTADGFRARLSGADANLVDLSFDADGSGSFEASELFARLVFDPAEFGVV